MNGKGSRRSTSRRFFAPVAKWAARDRGAAQIPEFVARAYRVATAGRPRPGRSRSARGYKLRDEVVVPGWPVRPAARRNAPGSGAVQALFELLKQAAAPVAIVGGADWSPRA